MDVSRRGFLKSFAAAVAAVSVASGADYRPLISRVDAQSPGPRDEWKPSFCTLCHQPACGIKVRVVDGVAVEIKGDPEVATNQGTLCPRGNAALMTLYSPYRVKVPLKRTNPERDLDQDPGWVEITWEEALDTVAERLRDARQTDPRSFIYSSGFGFEPRGTLPFAKAFGTPNSVGTPGPLCPEHFTSLHLSGTMLDRIDLEHCNYAVVLGRTFGGGFAIASGPSRHFAKAIERGMKLVTVSPYRDHQVGEWIPIRPGTETAFGLGLLHVILHEIGRYDEHWLKTRSNAPYLIKKTEQYLKGSRIFLEDYVRDPRTNKPLVWDEVEQRAVPFDHGTGESYALFGTYQVNGQTVQTALQILKDYVAQHTPEWASKISTVPAETIRNVAHNLVREARIGSTINIDGFEFPYRPACLNIGRGATTNRLGAQAYKALGSINVLLGNLDVPGGMQGCSSMSWYPFLQADEDGILKASQSMKDQVVGAPFKWPPDNLDMTGLYPQKHSTPHLAWKAVIDPETYHIEYPVKVLLLHGANPITSNANGAQAMEAFRKIPFIASIAFTVDEPAQMSDILLPEDHRLESADMYRLFRDEKDCVDENRGLTGTFVRRGVVPRVYNTRNANDVYVALARRAGFLKEFNEAMNGSLLQPVYKELSPGMSPEFALDPDTEYTWEEIMERKIKSDFGPRASFADFEQCSFKGHMVPTVKESYNYYYAPGNAVRLPIYYARMVRNIKQLLENLERTGVSIPNQPDMDDFVRHYSALPVWYEPLNYGVTERYPFKAVNWKIHFWVTNNLTGVENPWLQEVVDRYNPHLKVVLMPRSTGERLGFKEGDEVWVESQWGGRTQGTVRFSEMLHPECIGLAGNFGRMGLQMNPIARKGPQYNQLISADENTLDPVMGNLDNSPRVRVYKVRGAA